MVHNPTCGCPSCFHINYPARANPHASGAVHNATCGCPKCAPINYPGRTSSSEGIAPYNSGSQGGLEHTTVREVGISNTLLHAKSVLQDFLASGSISPASDQANSVRDALQEVMSEGDIPSDLKEELLDLVEKVREKLQE